MILTCPECATRYAVPDDKVGPEGRTVRCAHCGASWRARSDEVLDLAAVARPTRESEPSPAFSADTPGEALPRAYRERAQARKQATRAAVWGVVAAVAAVMVLALLIAAVLFRGGVVRAWPGAAGAFAAIGLPVNVTGLEFETVRATPEMPVAGRAAVAVSGVIRNVSDRTLTPPPVRAALLDAGGRTLAVTIGRPDRSSIPAGQTRAFRLLLSDPPAGATEVDVTFVLDDSAARGSRVPTSPRPSAAPIAAALPQ